MRVCFRCSCDGGEQDEVQLLYRSSIHLSKEHPMPNLPKPGELWLGGCPLCHCNDGMIHIGPSHWVYCKTHKVNWTIGSNLFSSWRHQTEDEQRRIYHELGFADFTEVEP